MSLIQTTKKQSSSSFKFANSEHSQEDNKEVEQKDENKSIKQNVKDNFEIEVINKEDENLNEDNKSDSIKLISQPDSISEISNNNFFVIERNKSKFNEDQDEIKELKPILKWSTNTNKTGATTAKPSAKTILNKKAKIDTNKDLNEEEEKKTFENKKQIINNNISEFLQISYYLDSKTIKNKTELKKLDENCLISKAELNFEELEKENDLLDLLKELEKPKIEHCPVYFANNEEIQFRHNVNIVKKHKKKKHLIEKENFVIKRDINNLKNFNESDNLHDKDIDDYLINKNINNLNLKEDNFLNCLIL